MKLKYEVEERGESVGLIRFEDVFCYDGDLEKKKLWIEIYKSGIIYNNMSLKGAVEYQTLFAINKIIKKELFKLRCKLFKRI